MSNENTPISTGHTPGTKGGAFLYGPRALRLTHYLPLWAIVVVGRVGYLLRGGRA